MKHLHSNIHSPRLRLTRAFDNFFAAQVPPFFLAEPLVNCEGFTQLEGYFRFSNPQAEGTVAVAYTHDGVIADVLKLYQVNAQLPTQVGGIRDLSFSLPVFMRGVVWAWAYSGNSNGGVAPSDVTYRINLLP